jgi:hypothetical protein
MCVGVLCVLKTRLGSSQIMSTEQSEKQPKRKAGCRHPKAYRAPEQYCLHPGVWPGSILGFKEHFEQTIQICGNDGCNRKYLLTCKFCPIGLQEEQASPPWTNPMSLRDANELAETVKTHCVGHKRTKDHEVTGRRWHQFWADIDNLYYMLCYVAPECSEDENVIKEVEKMTKAKQLYTEQRIQEMKESVVKKLEHYTKWKEVYRDKNLMVGEDAVRKFRMADEVLCKCNDEQHAYEEEKKAVAAAKKRERLTNPALTNAARQKQTQHKQQETQQKQQEVDTATVLQFFPACRNRRPSSKRQKLSEAGIGVEPVVELRSHEPEKEPGEEPLSHEAVSPQQTLSVFLLSACL